MERYRIDLHIHTALSPCAEKEMTPSKIVHAAKAKGLNIIAITDHNSAENVQATIEAAKGSGILVIPGMEVQTKEEVHLVCLFSTLDLCLKWQEEVYKHLPLSPNRREVFGSQLIMNSYGEILWELDRLLMISTDMSIDYVVDYVKDLGGLCIPAHIDRPSFSLIANLGLIPPELPVKTVELSKNITFDEALLTMPFLIDYTVISSSDAHRLTDIGINPTTVIIDSPLEFQTLKKAFDKNQERKVLTRVKDLSMHIIDILQNSIEAGASEIKLAITEETVKDLLSLEVTDNGKGMDKELLSKVTDPFFTTRKTRRVGLGIPLLKAAAERCAGELVIDSAPGKGTAIRATFSHSHIDRAPLGDIVSTIINFIAANPDLDLYFTHTIDQKNIVFDAVELRNQLEDVPLNNQAVLNWIKNYLLDCYKEGNS